MTDATTEPRTIAATLEVGGFYYYNFAASPSAHGTFEGWTDFGWMIFTGRHGAVFCNPALLVTIRPSRGG